MPFRLSLESGCIVAALRLVTSILRVRQYGTPTFWLSCKFRSQALTCNASRLQADSAKDKRSLVSIEDDVDKAEAFTPFGVVPMLRENYYLIA
ncbi:hypothetical protein [Coleofasciculus sp. H7-2]|uniref:hypothetical protein n=1 Tax=Coleofasciculus sp. H7-2 TaxID=3351545 RepID=UPI00366DDD97